MARSSAVLVNLSPLCLLVFLLSLLRTHATSSGALGWFHARHAMASYHTAPWTPFEGGLIKVKASQAIASSIRSSNGLDGGDRHESHALSTMTRSDPLRGHSRGFPSALAGGVDTRTVSLVQRRRLQTIKVGDMFAFCWRDVVQRKGLGKCPANFSADLTPTKPVGGEKAEGIIKDHPSPSGS